jgi:hypothetical protein
MPQEIQYDWVHLGVCEDNTHLSPSANIFIRVYYIRKNNLLPYSKRS